MRVTKAQAQANREHIVETASVLFRERGFDGVGVADLMAAAGFTHGGFYKHFGSKADLMAEAAANSLAQSLTDNAGIDIAGFVDLYVSRDHRDGRGSGCTMAALCGDAARQSPELKATFANGIEDMLAALESRYEAGQDAPQEAIRAKMLDMLAHAVGAIVLSRACPDDSALADEILEVCRARIIAALPSSPAKQP
ncbi:MULTISPECIES: TetR/AcrR family transcriptional regulator [unclassified Pseudomonas]|uniref:TetR/AcrR family transcriptional regulator n=1 Tax=unclassified Pseudomonas TaxID=196821 RepID=UPI000876B662|nr:MULTISPECIES: TetR family transcriptional regulator [unclassified Pseudomonas]SCZ19909.1 transcriptional regulator, TetR family [Pseudomonas sp. NFACC44-2]SDA45420.1 transcriptional regulator, TetR family [Pseudomonas sp. NFACC51]SEI45555.1 transcriptional regulator, TetR family [Pseudomonas sp. NFACC07-1]SFH06020.1 transcriptional regulator, TetR family [Pseudomonas sp. NFACC54]SFS40474.1 transcriptional regulator, TetR family [Pseudomonas sp. NFACC48-1]